MSNWVQACAVR